MKTTWTIGGAIGTLTALCILLLIGCRSIPCSSIEALSSSFDVFWADHADMLERDETLTTKDKQVVFDHALNHKRLIEELEKLCGDGSQ